MADEMLLIVAEYPVPPNISAGRLVREFLAAHSMVAIERRLAEELAIQNKDSMVYDPASDTYWRVSLDETTFGQIKKDARS